MKLSNARSRRLAAVAAVALLVPALAACGGDAEGADSPSGGGGTTLHVGQLGSSKVTEALLAAAGEDTDLDYDVEYSLFPTGGGGFIRDLVSASII